ncbi:DUF1236 domain-containing protein [Chthonobacter rhizosphaerae]|uniref:DUF1236 domain-containing protein n=1 Tax=Chthonobacter rhizosphaerae TaxID=2735553 RepID=UPI0015EF62F2|nr:DUF1236 domain-containing protein [Chthonobacter rhizosphaerae]
MTKTVSLAVAVLAGTVLASGGALAQTTSPQVVQGQATQAQVAYATTDLNLRAGPGPEYPVVTAIDANGAVQILGCTPSGLWCDVVWNGTRGWAYATYLAAEVGGQRMAIPEVAGRVQVPTANYDTQVYWDENYRQQPFYSQRDRYVTSSTTTSASGSTGAVTGAAGGAITGALIGGPVGAAIGGVAGATLGGTVDPPERVRTYVTEQQTEPVYLEGEVVVGAGVPETVQLAPVPEYEYRYAYVNGQRVLVDPNTRRIVHVYR